jgi:hypothetical protein
VGRLVSIVRWVLPLVEPKESFVLPRRHWSWHIGPTSPSARVRGCRSFRVVVFWEDDARDPLLLSWSTFSQPNGHREWWWLCQFAAASGVRVARQGHRVETRVVENSTKKAILKNWRKTRDNRHRHGSRAKQD